MKNKHFVLVDLHNDFFVPYLLLAVVVQLLIRYGVEASIHIVTSIGIKDEIVGQDQVFGHVTSLRALFLLLHWNNNRNEPSARDVAKIRVYHTNTQVSGK